MYRIVWIWTLWRNSDLSLLDAIRYPVTDRDLRSESARYDALDELSYAYADFY